MVVLVLGILGWTDVSHAVDSRLDFPFGPLRLVNQQPLQILFLQQFPDRAAPVEPGHALMYLNTALTNTLAKQSQNGFVAEFDLEMLRTVIDLRYGLLSNLEMGVELPFLYTYSGILDGFIHDVEKFFGRVRRQRRDEIGGQFAYRVVPNDDLIIRARDNALGIGDVIWKFKMRLWRERAWRPALSVRGAVKFPTSSTTRALSSGEIDGSIGVLLQQSIWRLTFHMNADVTFPGEAFKNLKFQPFFAGLVAVEYQVARPVSLVAQFRGDTRPIYDAIRLFDKRLFEVILGVNWALTHRVQLQVGVSEDVFKSSCCAADVSFFLNLSWRWSPSGMRLDTP